jgi:hypothetical protein
VSRILQRRCGLEAMCGYDEVFEHRGFYLQVWPVGHLVHVVDIGYAKPVSLVELCATAPNAMVGLFLSSPVIDLLRKHEAARDQETEIDWRDGMPSGLWDLPMMIERN